MWLHNSGFLFTWLFHALHCTKLFFYVVDNYRFHIKGPFSLTGYFPKPAAEPPMHILMDEISGPSKMQADLDLALAEQKINLKHVEILLGLFLYHK